MTPNAAPGMLARMPASHSSDLPLLQHYAALEPRERGYPEVPPLLAGFGEREYRYHALRSNAELIPRPIRVHARVPGGAGTGERCVERLLREIELVAPLFDDDRDVAGLCLEGEADRLAREPLGWLTASIARRFHVVGPVRWDYCIAVQTAADIDRIAACRSAGARHVHAGLTFGLAPQTSNEFASLLQTVIGARPERISIDDGALCSHGEPSLPALGAMERLSTLERADVQLRAAAYRHAGEGRYDLESHAVTRAPGDRIGLGPGATSRIGDGVAANADCIREWQVALDAGRLPVARGVALDFDDRVRADVLRRLLRQGELDTAAIEERFGVAFDSVFTDALSRLRLLESDGLVRICGQRIVATSRGHCLWRILAGCFDRDRHPDQRDRKDVHHHAGTDERGNSAQ